jgi:hypothetical protein
MVDAYQHLPCTLAWKRILHTDPKDLSCRIGIMCMFWLPMGGV